MTNGGYHELTKANEGYQELGGAVGFMGGSRN